MLFAISLEFSVCNIICISMSTITLVQIGVKFLISNNFNFYCHNFVASFIRVVGSEFVQKYLGEGPRMVRDVFRLARENSPAIIFIDEIDAIATKRFDAQTGGQ